MTRFAYLCLENQAVVRDKDARTTLIDLVGVLVQKFNHGLSRLKGPPWRSTPARGDACVAHTPLLPLCRTPSPGAATSIVHLLPHFEHLSTPLAELLEALCNTYDAPAILAEVLRWVREPVGCPGRGASVPFALFDASHLWF